MFDHQLDFDRANGSRRSDEPWRIDEILPLVLASLPVDEPMMDGSLPMSLFDMESSELLVTS